MLLFSMSLLDAGQHLSKYKNYEKVRGNIRNLMSYFTILITLLILFTLISQPPDFEKK